MKELMLWLQNNPFAVFIMFVVTLTSGIFTIILGWRSFYSDYLSKTVSIPVWLLIFILIIGCLLSVHLAARQSGDTISKELELVEGKSFGVQQVMIDGKRFERCLFDGSELVFNGKSAFSIKECKLFSPRISFVSYSALTLYALTEMYKDPAFRPIIDATIENIRTCKHPRTTPTTVPSK